MEERQNRKENEKLIRHKLRSNQIINERTPGSNISKRPFMAATPKSAPSKLFKSSVGVPIYRTPNVTAALRQVPSTIARLKNNKIQNATNKRIARNTLKEKNENVPDASQCLDSTTYTEFEAKLNRSSRITHRSSVLSSRKIVGTRISSGTNSKRKSTSKSKSIQQPKKKIDTSKLTPVRGKLGLPFLI